MWNFRTDSLEMFEMSKRQTIIELHSVLECLKCRFLYINVKCVIINVKIKIMN